MSEAVYNDFVRRVTEKASAHRVPINGSLELTFRCNLNCVMCYNRLPGNDPTARERELTTEEIQGILDQIADAGCLWLQLTGGEALMRPDFRDIYLYAKSKGFLIRLFTNGTMLTPALADFLAEHRPFSIEISLYGATRETYEAVTQVAGSYDRCLRGIRLLLDRNLPLSLKTVAITLNHHELALMQQLCDDLGVRFRYDPDINPRIDGDLAPLKFRLTPEQVVALDAQTPARARELAETTCSPRFGQAGEKTSLYDCAAGETAFHINPYGEATPCIMSRQGGCDLRQTSFQEAWQTQFPLRRVRTRTRGSDEPITYHHCTGWAELENADAEQTVTHAALVARLREKTFAKLTPQKG